MNATIPVRSVSCVLLNLRLQKVSMQDIVSLVMEAMRSLGVFVMLRIYSEYSILLPLTRVFLGV